jgi:hypothetical protein
MVRAFRWLPDKKVVGTDDDSVCQLKQPLIRIYAMFWPIANQQNLHQ